jgi:nucleotide-binding universal stress UspA family protein
MNFNRELTLDGLRLIKKILVGVDCSESSEEALGDSVEIAEKFSASVLILNVFQTPLEYEYKLKMF